MTASEPPETAGVGRLLRRRPPAAALGWAAAPFGPGSRVVAARPLPSAWLANHALDVADAAGTVHRLVLRRWARPGWDDEDPDFTATREATVLELLAPTPVPAPALVAADPDAAVCRPGRTDRRCGSGRSRWPPARRRTTGPASSTATTTPATLSGPAAG
jgi:hypothetical protein